MAAGGAVLADKEPPWPRLDIDAPREGVEKESPVFLPSPRRSSPERLPFTHGLPPQHLKPSGGIDLEHHRGLHAPGDAQR